jgi:hypothetical protein
MHSHLRTKTLKGKWSGCLDNAMSWANEPVSRAATFGCQPVPSGVVEPREELNGRKALLSGTLSILNERESHIIEMVRRFGSQACRVSLRRGRIGRWPCPGIPLPNDAV